MIHPATSRDFLNAIHPTMTNDGDYVFSHQIIPSGRAYGGEIIAQAVTAIENATPDDQHINSFHGYFLRPANVHHNSRYQVIVLREGRRFSTYQVQAYQQDKLIFHAIASLYADPCSHSDITPRSEIPYTVKEMQHLSLPADLVPPEELPTSAERITDQNARDAQYWSYGRNFDIRHVGEAVYTQQAQQRTWEQTVWVKTYDPLPDDQLIHQVGLGYICDYTLLEPVLKQYGHYWAEPNLITASVDHSMWWHHAGRIDDWIALVQNITIYHHGLALAQANLYTRTGILLASIAQQGLVEFPPQTFI